VVATLAVWLFGPSQLASTGDGRITRRELIARLGGVLAGAAPLVAATLLYNQHFFGAATRFGYEASEGPGHRLGFHLDPWGNPYGPLEALGYSSADLQGLSLDLLQTPMPVVVLVAIWFLSMTPHARGTRVLAAWALLPVAAYAFYWHHDLFMGPRLLYEALPGWTLLTAAAAVGLLRALPEEGRRFGISRAGLASALAVALIVAVVYAGPHKLMTYAREAESSGMSISAPAVERPAIVFVHSGWQDRLAARLAASGMRVDSIRAALAHNSTCAVQLHLDGVERAPPPASPDAASSTPALSFSPTAGSTLRELVMPSGSAMRAAEGEALDPVCEREATADFHGVLGVPPLLWQGDLPGLGVNGALFVRDFGPERNQRLIARFPEREPRALIRRNGAVQLLSYQQAMDELW
jgi:hypothetical protein